MRPKRHFVLKDTFPMETIFKKKPAKNPKISKILLSYFSKKKIEKKLFIFPRRLRRLGIFFFFRRLRRLFFFSNRKMKILRKNEKKIEKKSGGSF